MIRIESAETPEFVATIRKLFVEYSESLEVDLCFQGFAEEFARKYLAANYREALDHYEMFGKHFDTTKSYERYADLSKYLNSIGLEKAVEDYIQLMPWGTRQQVLDKFSKMKDLTDMQGIMPNLYFGGMPYQESTRNINCFVKHCLAEPKSWPAATLTEPAELTAA